MNENELKSRVNALERLNSTLLRITRENANKARKQPRKGSGYVFKTAEERWERIFLNPGGIFRPEIKTSDPFSCWKIVYETPYPLDMGSDDVKTAILTDLQNLGLPEPWKEPVMLRNDEFFRELKEQDIIFRIALRATGNSNFWEVNMYSTVLIFLEKVKS